MQVVISSLTPSKSRMTSCVILSAAASLAFNANTSFCLLAAKDSSSSMRFLAAERSSSFSDFICCAKPNPMHLKGEPDPRGLVAYLSVLFEEELVTYMECPSGLTCSAIASKNLNYYKDL